MLLMSSLLLFVFFSTVRRVICETRIPVVPHSPQKSVGLERKLSSPPLSLQSTLDSAFTNSNHTGGNPTQQVRFQPIDTNSSLQSQAIQSFFDDIKHLDSQPITRLTTPCVNLCRDTTYTKLWTMEDWSGHTKHALIRYARHMKLWPNSTTMHNIIGAVILSSCWSFIVSMLAQKYGAVEKALSKFTVTVTFLQAPILLLLTLRTNRSLDRLLESRKAWGALSKATRTFMGLICYYVIPKNPIVGCIMARYLCICGWILKGTLRNEDDSELIKSIMKSFPEEAEWIDKQKQSFGMKSPHAVLHRLRGMTSSLQVDLPPVILLRLEEVLYDIESTFGVCNRITTSPIPPTYTRHTSRVLVLYLSMLPVALSGMGIPPIAVVVTVACASYILIGIDEIGLEIEMPFGLMPLWGLSKAIQNEIMRQVEMMSDTLSLQH